jgi:hypothetical protein
VFILANEKEAVLKGLYVININEKYDHENVISLMTDLAQHSVEHLYDLFRTKGSTENFFEYLTRKRPEYTYIDFKEFVQNKSINRMYCGGSKFI